MKETVATGPAPVTGTVHLAHASRLSEEPRLFEAPRATEARRGDRSLVAGVNAMFRALEASRPEAERILDDPFARRFAERSPRVALLRAARFVVPGLRALVRELQTAHCVRHRTIDVLVAQALARGATQIVIVGAGYDTRALRLGAARPGVRWLEVDHGATQARKRARLAGLPSGGLDLRFESADLARDDLAPCLARAGFDPAEPSCFVFEGLVHYLAAPRVAALLRDASAGPAPRFVAVSYIRPEMAARASSLFVRAVRALREVPAYHPSTESLTSLGARCGLDRFASFELSEQVRRFAPAAKGRPARLSQDVALFSNVDLGLPPPSFDPR